MCRRVPVQGAEGNTFPAKNALRFVHAKFHLHNSTHSRKDLSVVAGPHSVVAEAMTKRNGHRYSKAVEELSSGKSPPLRGFKRSMEKSGKSALFPRDSICWPVRQRASGWHIEANRVRPSD